MNKISMASFGAALCLSASAAIANPKADMCDLRAREISGFTRAKPLEFNLGSFKGRISGSVSVGVSRTRGAAPEPVAPPFAGAASVEAREKKAEDAYRRAYENCMQGN